MYCPNEKPAGTAWKIYERLDSGRLEFVGVAVELGGQGTGVVSFRWAASRVVRKIDAKVWDSWHKDRADRFLVRLKPNE